MAKSDRKPKPPRHGDDWPAFTPPPPSLFNKPAVPPGVVPPPVSPGLMPEARQLLEAVDHLFSTGGYLPPTLAPLARDYNQALRVLARAAK